MKKLLFAAIGVVWSVSALAQLKHEQKTDDAEGGLIVKNSNNQSIRL